MPSIIFAHATVTIEALAPLLISRGAGDVETDADCVTDANGLPMLPGTSIAGVLRHALEHEAPVEARELFGYQEERSGGRSRVTVGHGRVHGADDRPVVASPMLDEPGDGVLALLRRRVVRDHVRITGRGTAAQTGKFDHRHVPAGARWTFDLRVDDVAPERARATVGRVLAPLFGTAALGAKTRSGLGAVRVERASWRLFDLRREADRRCWQDYRTSSSVDDSWVDLRPASRTERLIVVPVELEAEGFWIFGRGAPEDDDPKAQLTPVREPRLTWSSGGRGSIAAPTLVAPATGIKGALRHRTLYHARRLAGLFDEAPRGADAGALAVEVVFGRAKRGGPTESNEGSRAGRVLVSEGTITDARRAALEHVSLDRFTGAPVDGRLFRERLLFGGKLTFELRVDARPTADAPSLELGLRALEAALLDLCRRRLPLGGGSSRGHGVMRASSRTQETIRRALADARTRLGGGQ